MSAAEGRPGVLERASRASSELSLTAEFFDAMRANAIEQWARTGMDQTATREKMFFAVQTIDAVRRALFEAVESGKVERHAQANAELYAPAPADRRPRY